MPELRERLLQALGLLLLSSDQPGSVLYFAAAGKLKAIYTTVRSYDLAGPRSIVREKKVVYWWSGGCSIRGGLRAFSPLAQCANKDPCLA